MHLIHGRGGGRGPTLHLRGDPRPGRGAGAVCSSGRSQMFVRDVMKKSVVTCREKDSLKHCADLMRDWKIGMLPVVDVHDRLVGVVTDRDLVVRGLAEGRPATTEA